MSSEQVGETYAPARLPDALGSNSPMLRRIAAAARRGLSHRHLLVVGSAIFLLARENAAGGWWLRDENRIGSPKRAA